MDTDKIMIQVRDLLAFKAKAEPFMASLIATAGTRPSGGGAMTMTAEHLREVVAGVIDEKLAEVVRRLDDLEEEIGARRPVIVARDD